MPTGAIVREWPAGFSVWNEDETSEDGYTHLQSYARDPPRELVDDLFEVREFSSLVVSNNLENTFVSSIIYNWISFTDSIIFIVITVKSGLDYFELYFLRLDQNCLGTVTLSNPRNQYTLQIYFMVFKT